MKKVVLYLSVILCALLINNVKVNALVLSQGEYKSYDNKHSITITSSGGSYDGKYNLALTTNAKGSKLTGGLGSDNKSVTFYQLNDSKILSGTAVSYKESGETIYLYSYVVYSMDVTPVVDDTGAYELWRDGSKVNTYADLQSAVDAAVSGDTIKINKDVDATAGVYVKDKNITIDGNAHTMNSITWFNTIFLVEEGATLEIKNLTVDGKATGFEVDKSGINIQTGTSTKIPLKSGSDSADPKRTLSVVLSKGNLLLDKTNFNNIYVASSGAAVNINDGNFTVRDSKFLHNRAVTSGGSLYIGSNFKNGQTNYSIKNILIDNCEFSDNYTANGGAILMYNVEKAEILNTKFIRNTVTGGKGGAILINNESKRVSTLHNIPFPDLVIDNCLFEENWVGNDGSAIENHEAAMTLKNTTFRKNVGIHSTSSCGTVSYSVSEVIQVPQIIDNCIFEENVGSASTLADHATYLKLDVSNTKFIRNKSVYNSLLLYSANATFTNCLFDSEIVSRAVIEFYSYDTTYYDGIERKVVFKDVEFKNTGFGASDINVKKLNGVTDFNTIVVIEGDTTANINVWQANELKVNGNLTGNIYTDGLTPSANIVINAGGKVNGEIDLNENEKTITLIFNDNVEIEDYYWETRRFIYTKKIQLTQEEFFLEHNVEKEGYSLEYYIDKDFLTKWDYSVNENMNVYGKWIEHTHAYNGNYVKIKDVIYEQCECGHLGEKISLSIPTKLIADDNDKPLIVQDDIGLEGEYQISYYMLDESGEWKEINEVPKNDGTYKGVLKFNNLELEEEYKILPAPVVTPPETDDDSDDNNENNDLIVPDEEDKDLGESDKEEKPNDSDKEEYKNPQTWDNILSVFIAFVISFSMLFVVVINRKKLFKISL